MHIPVVLQPLRYFNTDCNKCGNSALASNENVIDDDSYRWAYRNFELSSNMRHFTNWTKFLLINISPWNLLFPVKYLNEISLNLNIMEIFCDWFPWAASSHNEFFVVSENTFRLIESQKLIKFRWRCAIDLICFRGSKYFSWLNYSTSTKFSDWLINPLN